jgi:predicted PurR-regulated permease PerM
LFSLVWLYVRRSTLYDYPMSEIPRNITVNITPGTILKGILIAVACGLVYFLREIVLVVLTAVVIASSIEPATKWLSKRGVSRVFSVVVLYIFFGGIIIGGFYKFLPPLLEDTSSFLNSVPQYIDSASVFSPVGDDAVAKSKDVANNLAQGISTSRSAVADLQSNTLSVQGAIVDINNALSNVSAGFIQTASLIFGGVLGLILIVVLSFYLSVQEDGVEKFLRIITPATEEKYVIGLWKRVQTKIGLWMQGQLILALLVGVLVFLGLTVLGVKNALLFAVFAAVLETIPLFGPILAAIPAVTAVYTDGGASSALLVAGLYIIIHQFENHLIYPLVVTKIVGVPPILVILSLIVGFKLAGFLGIILSVPMASLLVEYLDDIQRTRAVSN